MRNLEKVFNENGRERVCSYCGRTEAQGHRELLEEIDPSLKGYAITLHPEKGRRDGILVTERELKRDGAHLLVWSVDVDGAELPMGRPIVFDQVGLDFETFSERGLELMSFEPGFALCLVELVNPTNQKRYHDQVKIEGGEILRTGLSRSDGKPVAFLVKMEPGGKILFPHFTFHATKFGKLDIHYGQESPGEATWASTGGETL